MTCKTWPSITLVALLALLLVGSSGLPVLATVFNGGGGSTDYNDPLNWENDQIPGAVADDDAIIGLVGTSPPDPDGDGVPYLNPAIVDLNASPPGLNQIRDLVIGEGDDGDGTLNHTGGTLATGSTNWTFIGRNGSATNPSIGRYNLSGTAEFDGTGSMLLGADGGPHPDPNMRNQGYITVADSAVLNTVGLGVGRNDGNYGQVDQTGGVVNVASWAAIGELPSSEGLYNMSGGTFNQNDFNDGVSVGQQGTGIFDVSGTSEVNIENIRLGRNAGGSGLLNITGENVSFTTAGVLSVGGDDGVATGGQGTLSFTSASNVSPIEVGMNGNVFLNDGSVVDGDFDMDGNVDGLDFLLWQTNNSIGLLADWEMNYGMVAGFSNLVVDLETSPPPAGDVLLIDNISFNAITGTFSGLPEGTAVPNSGGRVISYVAGDGNDIALVSPTSLSASLFVPEPSSALLVLMGVFCWNRTRRQSR